jgi:antitoxin (DNA-binding transcriptional repressor) of toxin-antitoxin stability system
VIIARGGKQVARLTSIEPKKNPIRFGVLKGRVRVMADFDEGLPDEVLAGFEGRYCAFFWIRIFSSGR